MLTQSQKSFIESKIVEFGSMESVYRFYDQNCEVDNYARKIAPKLLAAVVYPMTAQMPKSNAFASKSPAKAPRFVERRREIAVKQPVRNPNARRCIDCGCQIPFERLEAAPDATRCLACQRSHEKMSPGSGKKGINEGLAGTREGHKRMRGQIWSDVRRRSRGDD